APGAEPRASQPTFALAPALAGAELGFVTEQRFVEFLPALAAVLADEMPQSVFFEAMQSQRFQHLLDPFERRAPIGEHLAIDAEAKSEGDRGGHDENRQPDPQQAKQVKGHQE